VGHVGIALIILSGSVRSLLSFRCSPSGRVAISRLFEDHQLLDMDGAFARSMEELQCDEIVLPEPKHSPASSFKRMDSMPESVERWDPWVVPSTIERGSPWRMYFLRQRVAKEAFWDGAHIATVMRQSTDTQSWGAQWRDERFIEFQGWDPGHGTRLLAGEAVWDLESGMLCLFFTTALVSNRHEKPLQLWISQDGVHFKPSQGWEPVAPDARWYMSTGDVVPWRDPHIFVDPATGLSWMFLSAAHRMVGGRAFRACINGTGEHGCPDTHDVYLKFQGCVAVAQSTYQNRHIIHDLPPTHTAHGLRARWQLFPPATRGLGSHVPGPFVGQSGFWEMERPKVVATVFHEPGSQPRYKYHLFFNCWLNKVNPQWVAEHLQGFPSSYLSNSNLYHFTSDRPEGPFHTSARTPVVPGSEESGLYGISLFPIENGVARSEESSHLVHGWKLRGDQTTRERLLVLGQTTIDNTLMADIDVKLHWDADGEPVLVVPQEDTSGQVCSRGLCSGLRRVPGNLQVLVRSIRDFSQWRGLMI